MAGTPVDGDLFYAIDGKLHELKGQTRLKSGYPFNPRRLNWMLQQLIEGNFCSELLDFKMDLLLKGAERFHVAEHFKQAASKDAEVQMEQTHICDIETGMSVDPEWLNYFEEHVPDVAAKLFRIKSMGAQAAVTWRELEECYGARPVRFVHIYDFLRQKIPLSGGYLTFFAEKDGKMCTVVAQKLSRGWHIMVYPVYLELLSETYIIVAV
ncbi:MAG: hypothetical protein JWN64_279 [Parcubacteria group bacterium]|nr:hypothetical protein [Parcubacteria group bacterium]